MDSFKEVRTGGREREQWIGRTGAGRKILEGTRAHFVLVLL